MIERRTTTAANVAAVPTPVNTTFVLPNDTAEHVVIEVTRPLTIAFDFGFYADISAITNNSFAFLMYVAVDGTNFQLHNTYTFAATENVAQFDETHMAFPFRITAKSKTLEGAPRTLKYSYTVDER